MISIKTGTQAWSAAKQDGSLKEDSMKSTGTKEFTEKFGNKDLGEVLNKVADPNWIPPSERRKVGSDTMDKDAFLKLFLTQLKNQDPTSPMESHDMAAQLAQFTSLETLGNIDSGITKLSSTNDSKKDYNSLKLIGKAVQGDSSEVFHGKTDKKHSVQFQLLSDAREVKALVKNRLGEVVKEIELNGLKKGKNNVVWDGSIKNGNAAPEGDYHLEFSATGTQGKKMGVLTGFEGVITGVQFTGSGARLMVGQQSVKMSDVKKIFEPADMGKQKTENKLKYKPPTDSKSESAPKLGEGNIASVGMSRDMVNKVKKTGTQQGLL